MKSSEARMFLVIGAMKAGTTTLYHDLSKVEGITNHPTKEPNLFISGRSDDAVLRDVKRFLSGTSGWVGDFSTSYTMAARYPGVPARARRILGHEVEIIYLLRDPIRRAISHHHHWLARGMTHPDVDRALLEDQSFIDVSSYGHQLDLWASEFGLGRIHVLVFEDYVADRGKAVNSIARLLGLTAPNVSPDSTIYNADAGGQVARGLTGRIVSSRSYGLIARRLIPSSVRRSIGSAFLRDSGHRRVPSPSTLSSFATKLEPDLAFLCSQLGWDSPPWNLSNTCSALTKKESL
jgi:hypothetical protein